MADNFSKTDIILQRFSELIKNGFIQIHKMREIDKVQEENFKEQKLLQVYKSLMNLTDSNLQEMIEEFENISKMDMKRSGLH